MLVSQYVLQDLDTPNKNKDTQIKWAPIFSLLHNFFHYYFHMKNSIYILLVPFYYRFHLHMTLTHDNFYDHKHA